MIRITGGINRSRLLVTPEGEQTKPTMDRVREGVFSALNFDIKNAKVLDLFAGSGSYGFESLSRGASFATFVDKSLFANEAIKENISKLSANNSEVIYKDCLNFLNETNDKFDIVFVDPPYKLDVYNEVVDILLKRNLLSEKGIVVLESENDLNIDTNLFRIIKSYKYGLAKIYILRK